MSQFDEALSLRLTEQGIWSGFADPQYEAMTGMYGGWTAAILLRAVMLQVTISTGGEQSTSGQQARLWSRTGKLLATTEQLGWFR